MALRNLCTRKLFRRVGSAVLKKPTGESVRADGIVSALRQEVNEPGGRRHELGTLTRPLYRFLGCLGDTEGIVGGVLTQAGKTYTVLDIHDITVAEREIATRLLLERRDEDGDASAFEQAAENV